MTVMTYNQVTHIISKNLFVLALIIYKMRNTQTISTKWVCYLHKRT